MKIIKKNQRKKEGFTLIEVVLVVVLVGGVFLAIYGMFGKTIVNDDESFHEITASNLAQEGVELVRNQRDSNVLAGDLFNQGINNKNDNLCVDPNSNSYGVCGGGFTKSTPYSRKCDVESSITSGLGTGENAIAVSCVVEWTGMAGIKRKARAMAILTNWQSLP